MNDPDAVLHALIAAKQFIENGIEFGYIRMPTVNHDPANYTLPTIQAAIEDLQTSALDSWEPIKSAPKDGSEITLSNGITVAQGAWHNVAPSTQEIRDADGRYVDQIDCNGFEGWSDSSGGMQPEPTHWMPLPPPPEINK